MGSFFGKFFNNKKRLSKDLPPKELALVFHEYILSRVNRVSTYSNLIEDGYNLSRIAGELSYLLITATDVIMHSFLGDLDPKNSMIFRKAFKDIEAQYLDYLSKNNDEFTATILINIKEIQSERLHRYAEIMRNKNSDEYLEDIGTEFSKLCGYNDDLFLRTMSISEYAGIFKYYLEHIQKRLFI